MINKISIIGVGPGSREALTIGALERIRQADLLLGAQRLLDMFEDIECKKADAPSPDTIVQHIRGRASGNICVLMSGDVGFYSGTKKLLPLLPGHPVETICGIGSLQYLCAKVGISWEDVHPASAHGRRLNIAAHAGAYEKTFFLTGGQTTAQSLCAALAHCGMGDARVTVGSRLSYEDEEMVTGTAGELAEREFHPLSAVLVERASPPLWDFHTGGIDDGFFARGEVPMTKAEVRCLTIAKLGLKPEDTVYDIGAGTGSVAVEMALAARSGKVYAIERNPEGIKLIQRNRETFGAYNIEIISGEAPEALEGLPSPEAAFVGGSGGKLESILHALTAQNPRVRVVVNAITLETLEAGVRLLEDLAFENVEVTQVSISKTARKGTRHLLTAQNPVFIISAQGVAK